MSQSGSIDFGFNNKVISIPFKDFIWQYPDTDSCMLGVLEDNDEPVLGDSFLRAAYVVYDQDNGNLHLAQAANCGTNLVAISTGSDAVPSVTGDCTAGSTGSIATDSWTYATAAPTVTSDIGSLTSLGGPGPQGTGAPTSSGTFCLTCTHTKATGTATAGAKPTKGVAAAREKSPLAAVVGVAALAAWLV